jgi:A/G-specific adenine glycosylase
MVPSDHELAAIRRVVLRSAPALWRDLPWRATRDAWSVLVSEIMLQQTQVSRVVEPFSRFIARFPTAASCAAAPLDEVLRAWAGLGYNRRAVNLYRAATLIVERHRGQVPGDLDALVRLPGVGSYTARAVLALAYGRPVGVVDTNVSRVLARAVAGHALDRGEAQRLADRLVPKADGWRFTQALFDLGARFCTAHAPRCAHCPLAARCRWAKTRAAAASRDISLDPAHPRRRQAPFAGSDREGRGKLVGALRIGPVALSKLADHAGWPEDPDRAQRIAANLVSEGLASWHGGELVLGEKPGRGPGERFGGRPGGR